VIGAYRKKSNFSISSGNSLPMPFAVIARSGATWQSHCYNRDCFALLAMTEPEFIEKLQKKGAPGILVPLLHDLGFGLF